MKYNYYRSIFMVEKLHRLFLESVKYELNKNRIKDITNVEALILYNIGERKLSVGDLTTYGCYLGSNVTYNLRKLVENGYVYQCPRVNDRRSSEIKLTEKGLNLYDHLEKFFENHATKLQENNISEQMIITLVDTLKNIEKYINKDII